ncbi:MAG: Fe-S-binding domain-containing protein, partial [Deltaproteobacteria bacterium]
PLFALLAALGVLFGAIYMLECVQKVFFGPNLNPKNQHLTDLNDREITALVPLVLMILLIGVKPDYFTSRIEPDVASWLEAYKHKRELTTRPSATEAYLLPEVVTGPPAAFPAAPGGPAALIHPAAEPSR